ncbi:hypothetical protein GCM10012275_19210 [Longimycelium tulufanense]|uniref:Uncharacterized protein n=1 Tax=Longimycelium tulufanense TaxID=907463 RepID=A0A8J3CBC8_9PSEU|nr:hypothetical protein [Longimycelium tulufanense]GGM48367.1 hypothetical protein GCM10012275_19210 [Longimycelium tulufanense]
MPDQESFAVPLFAQDRDYPALALRTLIALGAQRGSGVHGTTDLRVEPAEGYAVAVAPGYATVAGGDDPRQGAYLVELRSRVTLPVTPPGTLPRRDRVVARVYDADYVTPPTSGDERPRSVWRLEVLSGTPDAANPVPPSLPASALSLAVIPVAPGDRDVSVLDDRLDGGGRQVLLAGPTVAAASVPLRAQPGTVWTSTASPHTGGGRVRVRTETPSGPGWADVANAPACYIAGASGELASGSALRWTRAIHDPLGMWTSTDATHITVPDAGVYRMDVYCVADAQYGTNGTWLQVDFRANDGTNAVASDTKNPWGSSWRVNSTGIAYLERGTRVSAVLFSPQRRLVISGDTYFSVHKVAGVG